MKPGRRSSCRAGALRAARVLAVLALACPSPATTPASAGVDPWRELIVEGEAALLRDSDPALAVELFERAMERAAAAGDEAASVESRSWLAEALFEVGEFERGKELADAALAGAERLDDPHLLAWVLSVAGDGFYHTGNYGRALGLFERSLEVARTTGDPWLEMLGLRNVGTTLKYVGRYEQATAALERAAKRAEDLGDPFSTMLALDSLGGVHLQLGDTARAFEVYRRSLDAALAAGHERTIAQARIRVACRYLDAGVAELAEPELEQALAIARRVGQPEIEIWALRLLSGFHEQAGHLDRAEALLHEAHAIARALDSDTHLMALSLDFGGFWLERDPAAALGEFERALEIATGLDLPLMSQVHVGLGRALRRLGRFDEALRNFERAVAELEALRSGIVSEHLRSSFWNEHRRAYDEWIETLFDRRAPGDHDRAFGVSERWRARGLVEAIARARLDGTDARPVSPGEVPDPISVERLERLLGSRSTLVSWIVTPEAVVAFSAGAGGRRAWRLDLNPEALDERVTNYLDLIEHGDERGRHAVGRRLYAGLLAPVIAGLGADVRRLVLVPDGALHFLPFETLPLEDRRTREAAGGRRVPPLVERFSVEYAPSASVLGQWDERGDDAAQTQVDLLALAAPTAPAETGAAAERLREAYEDEGIALLPLPASEREARAVHRMAGQGSRLLLDLDASERRLKATPLDRFRILHFATHGLISRRDPLRSALVLGPDPDGLEDGFLQAREIYGLELDAEMVVLSACRTARGRVLSGEGVQGLARAFLHAGSRSVVASLWSVDDETTARLMRGFYDELGAGHPPGEALRRAKLTLIRQGTDAPRDWAAFVLIGDGGRPVSFGRPRGTRGNAAWLAAAAILAAGFAIWWLAAGRNRI